jgi:uncharacterized protein
MGQADLVPGQMVHGNVDGALTPAGRRPGADRGDPQISSIVIDDASDDRLEVGVWECTPGSWAISDRNDIEIFHVLSGRARLTGADGAERIVGPGDVMVLPLDWSGRWEILETLRKLYVIVRP